jgi:4-amino-4-deoxy-L-arabinose transferase-like glycosyltransferase
VVAAEPARLRRSDYALAAVPVFVAALALYANTLLPDVGIWDTAEFQTLGPVLGTAHPTGYPAYTLLLWLASVVLQPFGNEAFRADLLSALLMAGAAALLGVRVVMATRRWPLGLVAGVVFALTPVAWKWGLRADPHALHVFLAALLLVQLGLWQQREAITPGAGARWLLAAALVFGLSLGNHALTLLLAPGIAAFVLLVSPRILWRQKGLVLACAVVFALATVATYLYLPLRSAMDPPLEYADPQTWDNFWYVVLGEQFRGSFGPLPAPGVLLGDAWGELVRDFGALAIAAIAGVLLGLFRHPRLTTLGLLWFACTWLFAIGYPNAAIERYYLVPLLVAALAVGLAADAIWDALRDLLMPGGHGLAYRLGAATLVSGLLLLAVVPALSRYDQLDASRDVRGRAIVESVFEALGPQAVVISWWSYSTPLWYGQHVEGRRPDVMVIDDRDILDDGYGDTAAVVDAFLGERPVYVIRNERGVAALMEEYLLAPVAGVPVELYRVLATRPDP